MPDSNDPWKRTNNIEELNQDPDWQELATAPAPGSLPSDPPQFASKCNENAPTPDPRLRPRGLSSRQIFAVELLVQGWEDSDIVRRLRVNRTTLYRWKFKNRRFQSHLQRRRSELWSTTGDRLRKLLYTATRVVEEQLEYGSDASSYRAAYALLQLSSRFKPRRLQSPAAVNPKSEIKN